MLVFASTPITPNSPVRRGVFRAAESPAILLFSPASAGFASDCDAAFLASLAVLDEVLVLDAEAGADRELGPTQRVFAARRRRAADGALRELNRNLLCDEGFEALRVRSAVAQGPLALRRDQLAGFDRCVDRERRFLDCALLLDVGETLLHRDHLRMLRDHRSDLRFARRRGGRGARSLQARHFLGVLLRHLGSLLIAGAPRHLLGMARSHLLLGL